MHGNRERGSARLLESWDPSTITAEGAAVELALARAVGANIKPADEPDLDFWLNSLRTRGGQLGPPRVNAHLAPGRRAAPARRVLTGAARD
jgi:hypothetical protein